MPRHQRVLYILTGDKMLSIENKFTSLPPHMVRSEVSNTNKLREHHANNCDFGTKNERRKDKSFIRW